MNERPLVFPQNHTAHRALLMDGEGLDRKLLITAKSKGRCVHHLEVTLHAFIKRDVVVKRGIGIFLRVFRVDAVNLSGL